MTVLDEISHPTRWYSKLAAAVLALVCFVVLAAGVVSGYMVYRVVALVNTDSTIDLTNFPGHPEDMKYSLTSGEDRTGWFFPGLISAPTVILCPGYQTSRGDALPLAAALQEHGYNVFLFDIEGPTKGQYSSLGFSEDKELRAAISAVAKRDDVDRSRIGLWGANLGAYVALSVAEGDPRVRAVSVESAYDSPQDFAGVLIDRQGVASLPLLGSFARKGFEWMHHADRQTPPLSANLSKLAGVAKLYLATPGEPALAKSTEQLFRMSPEPKEMATVSGGNYSELVDEEKRSYEFRLVSFFLNSMPIDASEPAVAPTPSAQPKVTPMPTSAPNVVPKPMPAAAH